MGQATTVNRNDFVVVCQSCNRESEPSLGQDNRYLTSAAARVGAMASGWRVQGRGVVCPSCFKES